MEFSSIRLRASLWVAERSSLSRVEHSGIKALRSIVWPFRGSCAEALTLIGASMANIPTTKKCFFKVSPSQFSIPKVFPSRYALCNPYTTIILTSPRHGCRTELPFIVHFSERCFKQRLPRFDSFVESMKNVSKSIPSCYRSENPPSLIALRHLLPKTKGSRDHRSLNPIR